MATITVTVPDDLKEQFEKVFKDQDANEVVTRAMRRLIAEKELALRSESDRQQSPPARSIAERIMDLRSKGPAFTAEEIRQAREEGRP